jgi:prepilin-type N-terminal cleavage/methylation domain-containing protein
MCFKNQKGMTLVELMAAIAISGALAAIAIPKYKNMSVKAKNVELKIHLNTFYKAMESYTIFTGAAPETVAETGYMLPTSSYYTYTELESGSESNSNSNAGNSGKGASHKMTVCHNGHPINVANVSVYNAHLDHGDTEGDCPSKGLGIEIVPNFSYSSECPAGSIMETYWTPETSGTIEDDVDGMCTENI